MNFNEPSKFLNKNELRMKKYYLIFMEIHICRSFILGTLDPEPGPRNIYTGVGYTDHSDQCGIRRSKV
jgi:hypothetical protein